MEKISDDTIEIRDSKGKVIHLDEFFRGVEEVLSNNFKKYCKNIIPLSFYYCGSRHPFEAMMFTVGILCGIVINKKGYKIKFNAKDGFMIPPPIMLKMLYDLRERLNEPRE